ncbi:hypothetical protein F9U64_01250 [Gracilibacillus oryzae]|uniref:Sporulation protein Cse60 n=1 Tax=Gracilibacillus oryzae TaxID=1672701 RepID=A0A7C8KST7_9BACI|nr:hypothetical protein [Gracilibacillus oryzae]KAB8139279.1 hypothetical protein F9U64_01250 [Gracilibacillus oryzae]
MHRANKVVIIEGIDADMLEQEVNKYLSKNRNLEVVDIKYVVYDADVSPEFIEDVGKDKEVRYSAMLIIGEEV